LRNQYKINVVFELLSKLELIIVSENVLFGMISIADIDICQLLVAGWWFSPDTLVSSTNKTYHHDIAEILLKVALNTLTLTLNPAIDIIPKSTFSETMINSNSLIDMFYNCKITNSDSSLWIWNFREMV
jgi:hypothetical protein